MFLVTTTCKLTTKPVLSIRYSTCFPYRRTPYVCGIHMNSPRNPHHAGASGGTDINNVDTSPPEEEHVLYGIVWYRMIYDLEANFGIMNFFRCGSWWSGSRRQIL